MPVKACQWFYNDFTLFSALPVLFNMYTDKDSNLISDLRTKYGEESVRYFRKWEIIVKKMADYRNHRRFTLKCIKASITPVSCKLKNPLSYKSCRSYQIIHKVKKQLPYEQIRNINSILATLDKQREDQYKKFKDILNQNNQERECEQYLDRSRTFINRIKEHRHDKIKNKHIDKFKNCISKDLDTIIISAGIPPILTTSTIIPMLWADSQMCHPVFLPEQPIIHPLQVFLPHPWPPHLPPTQCTSTQQPTTQHPDNLLPTIQVPATWTNGLSIFPKPPSPRNNYPFYKKTPIMQLPPNTPHRSIHNLNRTSSQQITNPGSRWTQIWCQQNTETATTTTQQTMQPQPLPMQSPYWTQKGQFQGGSYSRQGGGHGHHGPTRLHQQSPKFTSRHQHL